MTAKGKCPTECDPAYLVLVIRSVHSRRAKAPQDTDQYRESLELFGCREQRRAASVCAVFHLQLHTSELNDGYDWGRLNLQSVTEQSSLDDFLATAELAGTEFVAGKWLITWCMRHWSLPSCSLHINRLSLIQNQGGKVPCFKGKVHTGF